MIGHGHVENSKQSKDLLTEWLKQERKEERDGKDKNSMYTH